MSSLDLDETEQHMLQHAANGYGAEITGGSPDDREQALYEHLTGPFVTVDGRQATDEDDVMARIVSQATDVSYEDAADDSLLSSIDVRRALQESGHNILFLEFDSMPSDTQTGVAQMMKGTAEARGFNGQIGYSCETGGSVVQAEFDLSSRVRTWDLD